MIWIVAGFALDFFTIGVTLYLNMQASRQQKQKLFMD